MNKHLWLVVAVFAAIAAGGSGAAAQDAGSMIMVPGGAAVSWQNDPPGLPKGAQIAVLAGDPGKPGPFVLRVKFPPGSVVAPHRHATAENLTVLSGDIYHGMGEKLDKAHGDRLQPGGFVFLPGMMPHSVWTAGAESVVQVTGTGPFGLLYVNPEDNPAKPR
jgi:quercetin dioxygenase-like cupin family protein